MQSRAQAEYSATAVSTVSASCFLWLRYSIVCKSLKDGKNRQLHGSPTVPLAPARMAQDSLEIELCSSRVHRRTSAHRVLGFWAERAEQNESALGSVANLHFFGDKDMHFGSALHYPGLLNREGLSHER